MLVYSGYLGRGILAVSLAGRNLLAVVLQIAAQRHQVLTGHAAEMDSVLLESAYIPPALDVLPHLLRPLNLGWAIGLLSKDRQTPYKLIRIIGLSRIGHVALKLVEHIIYQDFRLGDGSGGSCLKLRHELDFVFVV